MASVTYGGSSCNAVIFDVGSTNARVGWSGEDLPQSVFSTAAGAWDGAGGGGARELCVGERERWHARFARGEAVDVARAVRQGRVADWECLERVWEYGASTIGADLREHAMLIVEPSHGTQDERQRTAQLLFEAHGCPALYHGRSAVLVCMSSGKSTGVVLDSGGESTSAVVVHGGMVQHAATQRSALCGEVLTDELLARLRARGVAMRPPHTFRRPGGGSPVETRPLDARSGYGHHALRALARPVKEAVCRTLEVAGAAVPGRAQAAGAVLPDGQRIELQDERFEVPELLFASEPQLTQPAFADNPLDVNMDSLPLLPLPEVLFAAIRKVEQAHRKDLYGNVVLSGGNTLFPGLADRLHQAIRRETSALPGNTKPPSKGHGGDRKWSPWIGGSILSSFNDFHHMFTAKAKYEEDGRCATE